MAPATLLTLGLGAFFFAFLALVAASGVLSTQRKEVNRSLVALQGGGPESAVEADAALPFMDRVLAPAFGRLVALARRISPNGFTAQIGKRLDLAGNPGRWTPERVLGYKGLGLIVGTWLGFIYGSKMPGLLVFVMTGGLAAAGFFLPDVLIYNVGVKRQDAIRKSMADAIDLLTISVEAGLGFDAALAQVARNTDGPLAGEFFRVLQEMQIGKTRSEALRGLTDRTSVPELSGFVGAIVQADAFGIPIANVLRTQAKEMRIKRRQRAEETAMKIPVKILFPLLFFIFPALFVVIIGPGVINLITTM
jgi:tight adherence protein C